MSREQVVPRQHVARGTRSAGDRDDRRIVLKQQQVSPGTAGASGVLHLLLQRALERECVGVPDPAQIADLEPVGTGLDG